MSIYEMYYVYSMNATKYLEHVIYIIPLFKNTDSFQPVIVNLPNIYFYYAKMLQYVLRDIHWPSLSKALGPWTYIQLQIMCHANSQLSRSVIAVGYEKNTISSHLNKIGICLRPFQFLQNTHVVPNNNVAPEALT